MRIIINGVSAKAGGGITYLTNLLKYLPEIMANDSFLCVIQDIELPKELYKIRNLEIRKIKVASGNVLKRYVWENTGLIKLCNSWKADVLYCIANIIPIVSTTSKKIVMIQNVAPITPKVLTMLLKYEGIKKFLQMLSNSFLTIFATLFSHKTIVLSFATKALIKKYVPFSEPEVLYHGVNVKDFSHMASKPIKAGKEPYYIYVSNLYVYKGLEYLIDAYKHNNQLPKTFVAGHEFDSSYMNYIKGSIAANKLGEKIIFLNSVSQNELAGWYANSIGMVYTSWCENCPNILLEAKACGCLIVAMDIGPMPELCNGQEIIVKAFDGLALAKGMEKAIEIKKSPDRLIQLEDFLGRFTWKAAMEAHKKIFQSEL